MTRSSNSRRWRNLGCPIDAAQRPVLSVPKGRTDRGPRHPRPCNPAKNLAREMGVHKL